MTTFDHHNLTAGFDHFGKSHSTFDQNAHMNQNLLCAARARSHITTKGRRLGCAAARVVGEHREADRGVGLHLTALKVKQLQEELVAWGATKSGRKRALQLRLRALIIAAAAERTEEGDG